MRMLHHLDEQSNRELRWQKAARRLVGAVKDMVRNVVCLDTESLGRLDCSLRAATAESFGEVKSLERSLTLYDFFYMSKLWVFGAYEIARTLDENIGADHPSKKKLKELKRQLERVRIPLAKVQIPTRFPTDQVTGSMTGHPEEGWAWQVSATDLVSRDDLAERFLEMLESFPEPKLFEESDSQLAE